MSSDSGAGIRILAFVVAIAMVVGAIVLRQRLDGGDDAGNAAPSPTGASTAASEPEPTGPLRIVCATEFAPVCKALRDGATDGVEVTVEPAGTTADRLVGASGAAPLDGWLVTAPWPEIVADRRARAGEGALLTTDITTVATSRLVIAIWNDRAAVLADRCGAIDWSCIGDAATGTWEAAGGQAGWGSPKPGFLAPDITGTGLLVVGQQASERIGRADFSSRDLADDGFRAWFTGLQRSVPSFTPSGGSHLTEMLQFGPSRVDIVGTTAAEATRLLARGGTRGENIEVVTPEPAVNATVVVASAPGRFDAVDPVLAGDTALAALEELGWPVEVLAAGDAAATDDGVPPPGSLEALQGLWAEVVR